MVSAYGPSVTAMSPSLGAHRGRRVRLEAARGDVDAGLAHLLVELSPAAHLGVELGRALRRVVLGPVGEQHQVLHRRGPPGSRGSCHPATSEAFATGHSHRSWRVTARAARPGSRSRRGSRWRVTCLDLAGLVARLLRADRRVADDGAAVAAVGVGLRVQEQLLAQPVLGLGEADHALPEDLDGADRHTGHALHGPEDAGLEIGREHVGRQHAVEDRVDLAVLGHARPGDVRRLRVGPAQERVRVGRQLEELRVAVEHGGLARGALGLAEPLHVQLSAPHERDPAAADLVPHLPRHRLGAVRARRTGPRCRSTGRGAARRTASSPPRARRARAPPRPPPARRSARRRGSARRARTPRPSRPR